MVVREHTLSAGCVGMDPGNVYTLSEGQQNDLVADFIEELVGVKVDLSTSFCITHSPTQSYTSA